MNIWLKSIVISFLISNCVMLSMNESMETTKEVFNEPDIFSLDKKENIELMQVLLETPEGDKTDIFGKNVLHNAVFNYYPTELIEAILKSGFDINKTDDYGWNPLAALIVRVSVQQQPNNEFKLLHLFVQYGINLHVQAEDGQTVFNLADQCLKNNRKKKFRRDFNGALKRYCKKPHSSMFKTIQKDIDNLIN